MSPVRLFSVLLLVFAAQAQKEIIQSGLSEEEKNLVLQIQNRYRNTVAIGKAKPQPSAANMIELVWDEEAAQLAQNVSDTCTPERVDVKKGNGDTLGQNLGFNINRSNSSESEQEREETLVQLVKSWYDKQRKYRFGAGYNEYTQLVWADTEAVGCGYTTCEVGGFTGHLLVCNYYKAGNIPGKKPYIPGKRDCPKYNLQNSTKYSALCAK